MVVCFEHSVGKLQAITYFVSVILSFCVVIPVGITLRNFQGSCILFAQVVWDGRTIWPYSEPCCDFILYMNIACTLLYAFWMGVYSLWVHIPRRFPFARHHAEKLEAVETHEEKFRILAVNPVFLLINTLITLLVMSNAIVITVGLGKFCSWAVDSINGPEEDRSTDDVLIKGCHALQNDVDWSEIRIIRGETMGVKGDSFYTCLGIATVASWLLFLNWLFQWMLNFSQSFTMCSCDVAEEKRKPDQALLIAARRSRIATPSLTPGGRYTPPIHGSQGGPMRPHTFRPQPGAQMTRPHQAEVQYSQPQYARQQQQQPYIQRPPPQHQEPLQMQQGYRPPRR